MGLLTSLLPHTTPHHIKRFIKSNAITWIQILLYAIAIAMIMSKEEGAKAVGVSENALMPGANEANYRATQREKEYIMKEEKTGKGDWIVEELKKRKGSVGVTKKGIVYATMRRGRGDATEGIVIQTRRGSTKSVKAMLSLMTVLEEMNMWAKDIIWIFPRDKEETKHWLEWYHGEEQDHSSAALNTRTGVLQAALVIELDAPVITSLVMRYEGHNGQLPNLDLPAAILRIASKEGVPIKIKNIGNRLVDQASSASTGDHAVFLPYNIPAVTLSSIEESTAAVISLEAALRTVELTIRSINNLLEKFHAGYFFYLFLDEERFIPFTLLIIPFVILFVMIISELVRSWLRSDESIYSAPLKVCSEKEDHVIVGQQYSIRNEKALTQAIYTMKRVSLLPVLFGTMMNHEIAFASAIFAVYCTFPFLLSMAARRHLAGSALRSFQLLLKVCLLALTSLVLLPTGLLNWPLGMFLGIVLSPVYVFLQPSSRCSYPILSLLIQIPGLIITCPITWLLAYAMVEKSTFFAILQCLRSEMYLYHIWLLPLLNCVLLPLNVLAWTIILL